MDRSVHLMMFHVDFWPKFNESQQHLRLFHVVYPSCSIFLPCSSWLLQFSDHYYGHYGRIRNLNEPSVCIYVRFLWKSRKYLNATHRIETLLPQVNAALPLPP